MKKVALIMGSSSDFSALKPCIKKIKEFDIDIDVKVISAHRTPEAAVEFSKNAIGNGYDLMICAAGKAAHLAGIIAANTILPVIGIPMKSSTMDGMDSLLSTVQMPKGIPVATVAIDGSENAAILAAQILALKYPELAAKLDTLKLKLASDVDEMNKQIEEDMKNI